MKWQQLFFNHSNSDSLVSDSRWLSRSSTFSRKLRSVFRVAFMSRAIRAPCFSNWSSSSCTFLTSCLLRLIVFSKFVSDVSTSRKRSSWVRTFFRKDFVADFCIFRLKLLRLEGSTLVGRGLECALGWDFGRTFFCGIQRICSWILSIKLSKLKTRISTCVSRSASSCPPSAIFCIWDCICRK